MVNVVSGTDIVHRARMQNAECVIANKLQEQSVFADNTGASEPYSEASAKPVQSRASSSQSVVEQKKISVSDIKPESKSATNSIGVSAYNSYECNLLKVKNARKLLKEREQGILDKIWDFISSPFKNDNYDELDVMLAQLLYEMRGKSKDEKQDLIQDFYTDTRMLIDLPEAECEFAKYTGIRKLGAKGVRKITESFSKSRNFTRKLALMVMNRTDEKECVVKAALNDVPDAQNDLKKLIFEYLPEGMTESQVEEVFKALGKYADMQAADILASMQNDKFKKKFIDEIREKAQKVIEASNRRIKEYIKEFYETAKGKTVKRLINQAYERTQCAKKEVLERKEMTQAAAEKAKEARRQSEKAIAEAKAEETKCRSTAEKYGYKYLDKDNLYKFMKKESPMQAIDLMYAQNKEKKAYWAAYDADSAKRIAEGMEKIALRNFEFENMRMEAMFSRMQALVGTEFIC